jgi:tRNA threonylcarbamoyl adenosine modification protein YeaZ
MSALLLGFDASTPRCVIVVGRVEAGVPELLAFDDEQGRPNQASARLTQRIEGVLRQAGVSVGELTAIACGRGPGTFTGVRVALATAKGIALGAGVDLLPVSTLDALAASADADGFVVPLLDARRDEVYGSLMHCRLRPKVELSRRLEERVTSLEPLVAGVTDIVGSEPVHVLGSGAVAYRDHLPDSWRFDPDAPAGPTPAGLLAAMAAGHENGDTVAPAEAEATYLRKSYAELGINKPKRPFVKSPFV